MAHAYTPGLRVTPYAVVRKDRKLPLRGEVVAEVGDFVRRDQVVARTDLPGDVVALNLVNRLGCSPAEVPRYMLHEEGDQCRKVSRSGDAAFHKVVQEHGQRARDGGG